MTIEGTPGDILPNEGSDLDSLSTRERQLQEKITSLKDFVENEPERLRREMEERMRTLPPPSEVARIKREDAFMGKLTRNELRNEKRSQARSGFLLFLLVMAILALVMWIVQVVS